jgi:hypothetical protein
MKRPVYSECVSVTLGKQHAKPMRRVILSSVACPAVQYFSRYFMNGTIFEKKIKAIKHKTCLFFDVFFATLVF